MRRPPRPAIDRRRSFECVPHGRLDGHIGQHRGITRVGQRRRDGWKRRLTYGVFETQAGGVGRHRVTPDLSLIGRQAFETAFCLRRRTGDCLAIRVAGSGFGAAQHIEEMVQVQPEFIRADSENRRRRCLGRQECSLEGEKETGYDCRCFHRHVGLDRPFCCESLATLRRGPRSSAQR
jgi:hypothetical protein